MQIIEKHLKISSKHYKRILIILKKQGGQTRLIGGCVRDALLSKDNYDIDIITDLVPEIVINILSKAKIKVIPTGIKFGTVTAIYKGEKFEITTLRKDVDCSGRYAKVEFTSDFAEDAQRRDFTINALSYCPFENKIYDYFNGLQDLKEKKVIFIGKAFSRIREDYLRILRFFRFSSYYAINLDYAGLAACASLKAGLKILSYERIKTEMDKIIISKNAYFILEAMSNYGILEVIFAIKYFEPQFLKQAFYLKLGLATKYALLFYNVKTLQVKSLINWRFSKQQAIKILSLINFINLPEVTSLIMKKKWFEELEYQEYLFAAAIVGKLDIAQVENFVDQYHKLQRPRFPINGHDLSKMNVINKEIGTKLEYLKKIWLENNFIQTKSQLLSLISSNAN